MKHKALLIALWLLPLCVYSQVNKENYQLLWEITGNHIEKPSYLFGSMHVMDNRVFEFPDSVLIALSHCEAFANEVHFDSMMLVVMESLMGNEELLETYANEESDAVGGQEEDLTGMEDVDVADEDDYPTFLDAYLMNIAKKTGKEIYGLEDLRQQIDQLFQEEWELAQKGEEGEKDPSRESNEYQTMIKYYRSGDLAKIHDFMLPYDYENDEQLNARNVVMANSIERITQKQTLFAVVGAAHLAGKNSVIALLKERGYTLRPVTPTFTGYAERFNPTFINIPWDTIKDNKFGFEVEMPLEPFSFDFLKDETNAQAKISMDFGTGRFYFITAAEIPAGSFLKNYLYKTAIESEDEGKAIEVDTIKYKSISGREIIRYNEGEMMQYSKERLFVYKNTFYQLKVAVTKKELLASESIDRFFNSFQLKKKTKKKKTVPKITAEDREPRIVQNEKGAFSVELQGKPKERISKVKAEVAGLAHPKPYQLHIFQYDDKAKGVTQVVRYNDFPLGTLVESDSLVFEDVKKNILTRRSHLKITSKKFTFNGYPAEEFSLYNQKKDVTVKMRVYLRGNRTYILTGVLGSEEADKSFFNSFVFEPFQPIKTEEFIVEDLCILQFPLQHYTEKKIADTDVFINQNEIVKENFNLGYDENTGAIFALNIYEYSQYYKINNLDSFYHKLVGEYINIEQIYTDEKVIVGGYPGREFIFKQKGTNIINRIQLVQVGNHCFEIMALLPLELVEDSVVTTIFQSFRLLNPKALEAINLSESKSALILNDLRSTDVQTHKNAKNALGYYHKFEKEDLPLIYQALEYNYLDDTLHYRTTKSFLLKQFIHLADSTTAPFLMDYYNMVEQEKYKNEILALLIQFKTKASIDAFLELMATDSREIDDELIYNALLDTFSLFVEYYDDFFGLAKANKFQSAFLNVINQALEKDLIDPSFLQKDAEAIYKMGKEVFQLALEKFHLKGEEYDFLLYKLNYFTEIYQKMPSTPQVITQFNQIADQLGTSYISLQAINYLAKHEQPIKKEWILNFVNHDFLYYRLVHNLQKINRLDLIPKKYLKHKFLAVAMLNYDLWAYDQLEYGAKVVVKGEITIQYEGKPAKIYALQYENLDEEGVIEYYIAWAGPFPMNKKSTDFSRKLSNYTYKKWNDDTYERIIKKRVEEMIEEY